MTLKEQILADMQTLHFNQDEGAIEINFNGQLLTVNPVTSQDADTGFGDATEHGVLEEQRTYYFRSIDLDPVPVPWEVVDIDGDNWTVRDVYPVLGGVRITFFKEQA